MLMCTFHVRRHHHLLLYVIDDGTAYNSFQ